MSQFRLDDKAVRWGEGLCEAVEVSICTLTHPTFSVANNLQRLRACMRVYVPKHTHTHTHTHKPVAGGSIGWPLTPEHT